MRKAFTLIELMIVLLIFALLFGAMLTIMTIQDRSWRASQNKLAEQQEARRAMDEITRLLRQSSPELIINATTYSVNITDNGTRIDFYQGNTLPPKKITFKLNPDNLRQLLKKEGSAASVVVANEIDSINFGGGCFGCSALNCSTVANDCPMVEINIITKKRQSVEPEHQPFNLTSQVTLRNTNLTLPADTEIEQGEF